MAEEDERTGGAEVSDEHIIEAMARAIFDTEPAIADTKQFYRILATAALAAYRKAAWRPIEEAPKDGTTVLLAYVLRPMGVFARTSSWGGDTVGWWGWPNSPDYNQPTHFQPLLPLPEGET